MIMFLNLEVIGPSCVRRLHEAKTNNDQSYWTENNLLNQTVTALVNYGFITLEQVVSKYYHRLDHGYPIPSLRREELPVTLQPWLQTNGIYSRGRFGGWHYEVGNQDHSFMQGVGVAN